MGSTTLIDIIGSMLIGGVLLLATLRMNDQATKNTFQSQEDLTIQQNMTSLVNNILSDFRKIGYCTDPKNVPSSDSMIIHGDSTDIRFVGSLYPEANSSADKLDTVEWRLGTDTTISLNHHIRMLFRIVKYSNGSVDTFYSNLGVTQFNLLYYKQGNNQPGDTLYSIDWPTEAKMLEVDLMLEPTAAYDTAYSTNYTVWRQIRLTSMNMINR